MTKVGINVSTEIRKNALGEARAMKPHIFMVKFLTIFFFVKNVVVIHRGE